MTADQKLGIILGVTAGVNLLIFGSVFLYYSVSVFKDIIIKLKKG